MIKIKKVGVIFGGKTTEHQISILSGVSIIKNLDKTKYKIFPIYIKENGEFYKYKKEVNNISVELINDINVEPIENIFDYLKKMDVIFPVLHGLNGEDGTIQGLLEIIGKPYVGCRVLSSALCMDKLYTKMIISNTNIKQAKYMCLKKYNNQYLYINKEFKEFILGKKELVNQVKSYLKFPVFIKPCNSGSSVGVYKATNKKEFTNYLNLAFEYDKKVLIEEFIVGKEVECAVLGDNELITSNVGQIFASGDFYSFESKYNNKESKTIIPADIDEEIKEKIQDYSKTIYNACECSGLSRIDFFIDKRNNIIFNEINTMPGFTSISMYTKLMENIGISYEELLNRLIVLAFSKN